MMQPDDAVLKRGVGEREYVLYRSDAACATGEAEISGVLAKNRRDIDGVVLRRSCSGCRIGNGHSQCQAVVYHCDVEAMSAMQVECSRQYMGRHRWRCAICEHACRVCALGS